MAVHQRTGLLLGTQLSRPQTSYWSLRLLLCPHGHLSWGDCYLLALVSAALQCGQGHPFRDGRDEVTISVVVL